VVALADGIVGVTIIFGAEARAAAVALGERLPPGTLVGGLCVLAALIPNP